MLYLQITNNGDKNDMVSQMAHAKNLGEPFMAHLEDLYNIPCLSLLSLFAVIFKLISSEKNDVIKITRTHSMAMMISGCPNWTGKTDKQR